MQLYKRTFLHGLLWMAICYAAYPGTGHASLIGVSSDAIGLPVDQILISGNEITQERFILKWAGIRSGQVLTIPLLNKAEQELRDTGLFRNIHFQTERHENGELTLRILLEEKNYWLLLPRLSRNGDGDVKAGVRLRMYNLNGGDQTLELLAQQEEQSNGDDSEEVRFKYSLPLYSSPYDLKWTLRQSIENTEVEDFDNIETIDQVSMTVERDWHIEALSIPVTVETGISFKERGLDEPYPDFLEAREAGFFNSLKLELIFDDVHNERYRRYGVLYSLAFERGFDWLGSDYESSIFELQAIGFIRLNRYDNFNYRVVFAASNDSPFDFPYYGIGGASNIRGLESVDDRGDAQVFANLEYVFAYKKHPGVSHTLFLDIGNVYDELDRIDLGDVHYTVGTGFRWKIESFVRTDLFLDYGYDVENNEGKLYGGTSLAF